MIHESYFLNASKDPNFGIPPCVGFIFPLHKQWYSLICYKIL